MRIYNYSISKFTSSHPLPSFGWSMISDLWELFRGAAAVAQWIMMLSSYNSVIFFPSISKSVLVRFWYSLRWWQLPFWSKLGVDFGAPEVCSNCRLFAYFTPPPSFFLSFHSIFKYFSQFFTLSRPLSFAFYFFTFDELLCFWNHNFSLLHSVFSLPSSPLKLMEF